MSLVKARPVPALPARRRAHRRARLRRGSTSAGDGDSILDLLKPPARPARSCATSSSRCSPPATRRPRPRSPGRSSGSPATPTPLDTDEQIDAFVKEVLRTRPVLSITARKTLQPYTLGGYTLPTGVYVAACIYLAHRRAGPTSTRARRRTLTFIPFGGGTRRCLGAAFATLEMREVLRAVDARFTLAPDAGRRRADAPPQRHPRARRAARLDHPDDPLA